MDYTTLIDSLKQERDRIDEAIGVLGGLGGAGSTSSPAPVKRRGRPPGSTAKKAVAKSTTMTLKEGKKAGRRGFTPAQKREAAARMVKYWAKRRREAKKAANAKAEAKAAKKAARAKSKPRSRAKVTPIETAA